MYPFICWIPEVTMKQLKLQKLLAAHIKTKPFVTHPKQWDFALKNFEISTPWIIGLDSDHIVLAGTF